MQKWLVCIVMVLCGCAVFSGPVPDGILIADFEGETYGDWVATGEAFGPGPARGTLPGQMTVTGFEGERLVNTYFNGDDTTGTLTSPQFDIQRKYIHFLIGGGMHPGNACINLLIDGKVVRIRVSAKAIKMGLVVKPPKRNWSPPQVQETDAEPAAS